MSVHCRIGPIGIESPFTLAALSGFSDMGMRATCRMLGASMTRNEVTLDQFVLHEGKGARNGSHLDPNDHPVAAQLMGNDPIMMGQAAAVMVRFGYDMLDINFGCPVKKVLGRCRGGFLLGEPDVAVEMIRRVRDSVDVPVTIKMRLGRDDTAESEENFWRILEEGVALGVAGVAVHGRTVQQRYEGPARWARIAEVKRRFPNLALFGSGDLFSADDCLRMIEETGCDGVTIARGAINNPWIFRECAALWKGLPRPEPPTLLEQGDLMDLQYQFAIQQYGPERASRQMRKFGIKRAHLHPLASEVHLAFVTMSTPAEWHVTRRRYYSTNDPAASAAPANASWSCESC